MYTEKIDSMIFEARKARNQAEVLVYQDLKNEFLRFKTAKENIGKDLDDAKEFSIIQKMINARKESADIFNANGRPEMAEKETAEAEILGKLLPEAPDEVELEKTLDQYISYLAKPSFERRDIGAAMKYFTEKYPSVDKKMLGRIIQKRVS